MPELLLKSGDSSPRVHNMAVHTILSMADVAEVRLVFLIFIAFFQFSVYLKIIFAIYVGTSMLYPWL